MIFPFSVPSKSIFLTVMLPSLWLHLHSCKNSLIFKCVSLDQAHFNSFSSLLFFLDSILSMYKSDPFISDRGRPQFCFSPIGINIKMVCKALFAQYHVPMTPSVWYLRFRHNLFHTLCPPSKPLLQHQSLMLIISVILARHPFGTFRIHIY